MAQNNYFALAMCLTEKLIKVNFKILFFKIQTMIKCSYENFYRFIYHN